MKFGCSFGIFLNLAHLICRSTDISKCFSGSLRLRDNESPLYLPINCYHRGIAEQNMKLPRRAIIYYLWIHTCTNAGRKYRKNSKYWDMLLRSSLIRIYTVCHSFYIYWRHYFIIKFNGFILRTTTVAGLGVPIFRVFTVLFILTN